MSKLALLVPDDKAGKVIGKDGAVFKLLRQYCCELHVQQVSNEDGLRRADLRGLSAEHIAAGLQVIIGRLLYRQEEGTLILLVPAEQAEVFQGEDGEKNLERIREACGVTVAVDDGLEEDESERRITLDGNPTFMGQAFRLFLTYSDDACEPGTIPAPGPNPARPGSDGAGTEHRGPQSGGGDREEVQVEVHMVVPDHHAGDLLGEEGESLRRTQEHSGCRSLELDPEDDGADRKVVMHGSFGACVAAQRALHGQLADAFRDNHEPPYDCLEVVYMVPSDRVGAVVGKAGAGLRQVREATGVKVELLHDEVEGHRPCVLTGPLQEALYGEEFIHNLVVRKGDGRVRFEDLVYSRPVPHAGYGHGQPPDLGAKRGTAADEEPSAKRQRSAPSPREPRTTKMLVPSLRIGSVIGKKGAGLAKIREAHRVKLDVLKEDECPHWPMDRLVVLKGPMDARRGALKDLLTAAATGESAYLKLLVPADLAGRVIGKNGENLKAIREECGAALKLERDEVLGERLAWCQGPVSDCAEAAYQVMDLTEVEEPDDVIPKWEQGRRSGQRRDDDRHRRDSRGAATNWPSSPGSYAILDYGGPGSYPGATAWDSRGQGGYSGAPGSVSYQYRRQPGFSVSPVYYSTRSLAPAGYDHRVPPPPPPPGGGHEASPAYQYYGYRQPGYPPPPQYPPPEPGFLPPEPGYPPPTRR